MDNSLSSSSNLPSTTSSSIHPPCPQIKSYYTVPLAAKISRRRSTLTASCAKQAVAMPKPRDSSTKLPSSFGPLYHLREHLPYRKSIHHSSPSPTPPSPPLRPASYLGKSHQRPQKNESRCLQYIMPGIFMAFEDDNTSFSAPTNARFPVEEELRTTDGQRFTHIIKLTTLKYPSETPDIKSIVDSHKTQTLNLGVPPNTHDLFDLRMRILASEVEHDDCDGLSPEIARKLYTEYGDIAEPYEGIPLLTPKQLLASRKFMCATGYDLRRRQGARILITAPRDHCTDMVSVLACYLAYASRNTVVMILREIDKHEPLLRIWKNTVSGHGAAMIQDVVDVRS